MDKIYSRKRIIIPSLTRKGKRKRERRKITKFFPIIIIAMLTMYIVLKAISPIFEDMCVKEASIVAIDIITNDANKVLEKYNYQDIVSISKGESTNILKTDVVVINNIATEIINSINSSFKDLEKQEIEMPIGALTGSKYLTGTGPNINIKIIPIGAASSEIKTEFEEKGINQTVYRIYLCIDCEIKILMPYESLNRQIKNQILLVETAIVGDVPETYYNLDNLTNDDMLKLID